ncbi:MAG TPA: NAD(P)H-hydrate dehydratase [Bacteroidia bacterium]|nr:NAD(P)H-hydrate dehydratase [Bacteroidia bacterium]
METLNKKAVHSLIKPRVSSSHKGDHGHALIIAGNKGKMGACVISARACLRSGAGLLSVSVPQAERLILQTTIPEAMVIMREEKKIDFNSFSSIGIGPGIGVSPASVKLIKQITTEVQKPLVLDADALTIFSKEKLLLKKLPVATILTPHPKEFDRLFGNHKTETERMHKAIEIASLYNIVMVLKGAKTIITCNGFAVASKSGNAGLAKGGSGDALTGMITALLAQGYTSFTAAKIGVYLHGLAANIALKKQSMESMLISDVIECIGQAFKKIMPS